MKYLCFVLAICMLPIGQALAADITVDADCSLANAIRSANGEAPVEPRIDCEAGDGPDADAKIDNLTGETLPAGQDTISIDVSGTDEGNIPLDATLPVTSPIVVNGNGHSVNGGGKQIFAITAGLLRLNDLTLSGGFSLTYGGAIAVSNAALTLNNSVISGSGSRGFGGGIYALDSDLTLADSVVSGNVTNAEAADFEPVVEAEDETDQTEGTAQSEGAEVEAEAQAEAQVETDLPAVDGVSGGGIYFSGESSNLVIERSGIDSNDTPDSGGGLYIASGSATINNTTISGNSAFVDGGGIYNAGDGSLTHATIVGNSANSGGGILDAAQLQLYNSILSDNTGGDCSGSLNANLSNIIRDASCNHDGATADPKLLLLSGSPAYYVPQEGSPAIDAADAGHCLAVDQRGLSRVPEACDIGAAEYEQGVFNFQIQSALAALTPGSGGGGAGSSQDEGAEAQPTEVLSNCAGLPGHIRVTGYDNGSNVNCTHLDYSGLHNQTLVNGGALQAVDIFGWVASPISACFQHDSGGIVLLDAATSPREIVPLRTRTESGWQCANVDRAGTVVLMPLGFFTSGAIAEPLWDLADCTVTTSDILNLREHPNAGSNVVANVLNNVSLASDLRATHFYRVNYYGIVGWLSQGYLTYSGNCV